MGCILKSSAKYVFDYFGSIFENTNFDTGSWLQFSLSPFAIHTHLECVKPEWSNSNKFFPLLLCGVWDCISDFLGGRTQHQVQFLFPNGYIDIHNNLYFSSFDKPFHFQWPRKKFENGLCVEWGWCLDTWDSENNNPFYIKFHPVLRGGGEKLYQTHYRSCRFFVVSDISLSSRNTWMSH